MRKFLVFYATLVLLTGSDTLIHRTDEEMFKAAHEVYEDFLFEYRINSTLLGSPTIKTLQGGSRSYTWIARGGKGTPAGIEVIVTRNKFTKPEMILIGNRDDWVPLLGSKR